MITDINETVLTAYALNELSANDRAAVDAYLPNHPEARELLAEIRATAELMTAELASELAAATPLSRPIVLPIQQRSRWGALAIGLAAAAAVAGGLSVYLRSSAATSAHQFATTLRSGSMIAYAGRSSLPATQPGQNGQITSMTPTSDADAVANPVGRRHQISQVQDEIVRNSSGGISAFPPPHFHELADAGATVAKVAPIQPASANRSSTAAKIAQLPLDASMPKVVDESADLPAGSTPSNALDRVATSVQQRITSRSDAFADDSVDRDRTITGLVHDAKDYAADGKYVESLAVIEHIKKLDPTNAYANSVQTFLQDKSNVQRQRLFTERFDPGYAHNVAAPKNETVAYEDVVRYPNDRPNVLEMRDQEVSADRGKDFGDAALVAQLDRHLPDLRFNANSLTDVIDFLRDVSGANIDVDWPALEKAGISKDTPITARMKDIKTSDALAVILKNARAGHAGAMPGFTVREGLISISVGEGYNLTAPTTRGESYNHVIDNSFLAARENPLSTFSADVDSASYANVRRFIENGLNPPPDAVRIEELINYFPYSYPAPKPADSTPIAVNVEVADCPWASGHRLARVGIKAKVIAPQERSASNLVFLIDVSGSMGDENKLPMLKTALKKFVNRLSSSDHVSIVTYAGNAAMALPSTPCGDEGLPVTPEEDVATRQAIATMWQQVYQPQIYLRNGQPVNGAEVKAAFDKAVADLPKKMISGRDRILAAIDSLNADGETNGGDGIQMAYRTAVANFLKGGVNRVILATDGDFNVGVTSPDDLVKMIEEKSQTGVYLTVLGLGMGNIKDSTMEKLATHGKGNYAYLDSLGEADKVLGRQIDSTLVTVAKDVKLQVEFNPAKVASYRLIGYEHRAMPHEDFNDDQKTAGEMGAGHAVTALYEIIPTNDGTDHGIALKYQAQAAAAATAPASSEMMTVSVRYQPPQGGASQKIEVPVQDHVETLNDTTNDFRFASAVAAFGMILRDSNFKGTATLDQVRTWATAARGEDVGGFRSQFVELVNRAAALRAK